MKERCELFVSLLSPGEPVSKNKLMNMCDGNKATFATTIRKLRDQGINPKAVIHGDGLRTKKWSEYILEQHEEVKYCGLPLESRIKCRHKHQCYMGGYCS